MATFEKTDQVNFRETVDPASGVRLEEKCRLAGRIAEVTFHFPDGCDALVQVAFGKGGNERICPSDGYIALNDATPTYRISEEIAYDERLWVEVRNGDRVNVHTPSVIVTIIGGSSALGEKGGG